MYVNIVHITWAEGVKAMSRLLVLHPYCVIYITPANVNKKLLTNNV